MESCIYEGQVKHTRTEPAYHRFNYRLFLVYLDLDELDEVFKGRWLWSARRPALARLRRSDHIGPKEVPLGEAVRDLVLKETGTRPTGPIRMLTHLSYFGFCFNPVSFYYCFEADGETVETIVAEVNNTPWGERDTYVLPRSMNIAKGHSFRFQPEKKMHVSPYMDMQNEYDWCFTQPRERLTVFMANSRGGKRFFDVSMALKRTEISGLSLSRVLFTFPFMTVKVVLGIYWEALRLWLKRCPVYAHPDKKNNNVAVQSR